MTLRHPPAAVGVLLFGASGRMGQAIQRLARERGIPILPVPRAAAVPDLGEGPPWVVVDFSGPGEAQRALETAADRGLPFVGGTTGLGASWESALENTACTVPVLWASNMSLGVAILHRLVREAARMLPASYDCEIVELHHRRKEDCPSGTALTLASAVAQARESTLSPTTARSGRVGPRAQETMAVLGVRGGEVIGEHTVYFLGDDDRIEITHRAGSRDLFAAGALAATQWLVNRPPGLYTLDDMVASGQSPA